MKILVLNGSPKNKASNTMKITEAFVAGINTASVNQVEVVNLYQEEIKPCIGCFTCWTKTPGICIYQDAMPLLLEKLIAADLVIWSMPLYYMSMPSQAKAFMDRMLPTSKPEIKIVSGEQSAHPSRYDLSHQKIVLISTCGFFTVKNNYEALEKQFEIIYGEKVEKILCPEGELLSVPQLRARIDGYLDIVKAAGAEYATSQGLSTGTKEKLAEPFYPPEQFVAMANASWEINEPQEEKQSEADRKKGESFRLMKQMAAIYNPKPLNGQNKVLEMAFTDLAVEYQLQMGTKECKAVEDKADFLPYTTRIETPFSLWQDISAGKVDGPAAMAEQKYRTLGDFSFMMVMSDVFGSDSSAGDEPADQQVSGRLSAKSTMLCLLLPWMLFWSLAKVFPAVTAMTVILVCTLMPLMSKRIELTKYDKLSNLIITGFSVALLLGGEIDKLYPFTYLIYGLLWLVSVFVGTPITAHYSKNDYGGNKMMKNVLFIKTNAILSVFWSALYFLMSILSFAALQTAYGGVVGILTAPVAMIGGLFTAWFQRWYPAKVARGSGRR